MGLRNGWIELEKAGKNKAGRTMHWFRCPTCESKIKGVRAYVTTRKSCKPCYHKRLRRHGMTKTKEYRTWSGIIHRCYGNSMRARTWQKKGIKVCDRWKDSFEAFLQDMGKAPNEDSSIDRIDSRGNYCKQNCRWISIVHNITRVHAEYMHISKYKLRLLSPEALSVLGICEEDLQIKEPKLD